MTEARADNPLPAQSIAALELGKSVNPGLIEFHILKQPIFIQVAIIVSTYGCILGCLQYLYKINMISRQIKDCYGVALFLCFFVGGLHITKHLNVGKIVLIVIYTVILQIWEYLFYETPQLYVFYIVLASWLIVWWAWKEPEMMAGLGLRSNKLLPDLMISVILFFIFLVYFAALAKAYGFTFEFEPWKSASHAAVVLPQNIVFFSFLFAIWNQLQARGASQAGIDFVFIMTGVLMQTPAILAFLIAGAVGLAACIAGLLGNTLIFVLIMRLTFRNLRSSLPAAFLFTAFQGILVMTGIL